MAKKKVTKKENKSSCVILKMLGMVIEVVSLFVWSLFLMLYSIASHAGTISITPEIANNSAERVKATAGVALSYSYIVCIAGIIFLVIESINYFLYLTKRKETLVRALVGEIILVFILFFVSKMGFPLPGVYNLYYIILVPIVTGFIKLLILRKD